MGALHVRDDRLVKFISAHTQAPAENNAGQGNNRDLTGAATDIDDDPLSAVAEGTGRVLQELSFLKRVASSSSRT